MSVQYFLQGKLLGIEPFLLSALPPEGGAAADEIFAGRCHWVTLLAEVLPRALLAELGLAKILLGTSGGGQFLVVLPEEAKAHADQFLSAAAGQIAEMSAGHLRLIWAGTENLGDWTDVRKRIAEDFAARTAGEGAADGLFEPFTDVAAKASDEYFAAEMFRALRDATSVGWSPEAPARLVVGGGKYTWPFTGGLDGITFARHTTLNDDGSAPAETALLAARSEGRPLWGVLCGDVDNFGIRLRRAQSVEEHIQLSLTFKQFFAGELEVMLSLPDYWRKITVLYSGGDDFAVYGSWDALIPLAREIQRLFHRLAEETLREFPGPEGKTISMALALAPPGQADLPAVYEDAVQKLEIAKSSTKDAFHLLGRTLEWKSVGDAADMKDIMVRMVRQYRCPPQFVQELGSFYKETAQPLRNSRTRGNRFERPWRFHRRLNRVLGPQKDRELQKLRTTLTAEFIGRNAAQARLRPAGRVALEWASLLTEA
ncbi:MAG: hypothetical protein SFV54_24195 [Bryobacteraceae bacterium]|nr:hypothetical protein [Bryobacteraceae bacterium]